MRRNETLRLGARQYLLGAFLYFHIDPHSYPSARRQIPGSQSGVFCISVQISAAGIASGASMITSSWTWPTILQLRMRFMASARRSRETAWTMFSTNLGP